MLPFFQKQQLIVHDYSKTSVDINRVYIFTLLPKIKFSLFIGIYIETSFHLNKWGFTMI